MNDVLRGTTVEQSITVFNLGEEDAMINLSAEGAAANWIKFYVSDTKSAPLTVLPIKGRENKPVIVQITVPSDTANGIYNATIHALIKPSGLTEAQMGVSASMEAVSKLSISVTGTQSVSGTVDYIIVDNTEVNFPLSIRVLFHNTGNVAANPEIVTAISGKSGVIDTITYSEMQVSGGASEPVIAKWTKTNIEPGDYTADVKVNLAGTQIASKNIPFNIAPSGTLSRQGNLTSLTYTGKPAPDSMLKISGIFANSGKIETKAKMIGEVYKDGTLADTFTSDELSVPINDQGELTYYLKVTSAGSYTVKAYILYEGKKTDIKEVSFNTAGEAKAPVTNAAGTNSAGTKTPLLPGLAIFAIIGSIILISTFKGKSQ